MTSKRRKNGLSDMAFICRNDVWKGEMSRMNRTPHETVIENPWKDKGAIPYPNFIMILPALLMYLLAALVPVFFTVGRFALIALIGLTAGTVFLLRMPRVIVSILLTSYVPLLLLGSAELSALLLSIIVGTACTALLLTAVKDVRWVILLPVAAWAIAFFITRDAALSALVFVTLPAGLLLTYAIKASQRRTAAICCALGGFLITVLALLVVYFLATYGTVDRDVIVSHFETQRVWLVDIMERELKTAIEALGAQGSDAAAIQGYFTRDLLTLMVSTIYNVLPGLVIMACAILAYVTHSFLCGSYFRLGMKTMLTPAALTFTMSPVSAVIYVVAFFITVFVPVTNLFGAVVQNVLLMLMPGFLLMGFTALRMQYRTARRKLGFFLLILAILFLSSTMILHLLAFYGAMSVLIATLGSHLFRQHIQKKLEDELGDFTASHDRRDAEKTEEPEDHEEPEEPHDDEPSEKGDGDGDDGDTDDQN